MSYQYLEGWREWYVLFPKSSKKKKVMLYVYAVLLDFFNPSIHVDMVTIIRNSDNTEMVIQI